MFASFRAGTHAGLIFLLTLASAAALAQETATAIAAGSQVTFTYTLSSEGEVLETNVEAEPLVYTQGGGEILPALEAELVGLSAGDKKTVNLVAADAYGEIRQESMQEVPLDQLPEAARQVGAMLQAPGFPGPIRVAEVRESVAVLDFNHPLAGKDLTFDIVIVAVAAAPIAPAPPSLEPAN